MNPVNASEEQAVKDGAWFNDDAADREVHFIEKYGWIRKTKKKIILHPLQRDYVRRMYGWMDESGQRLYRKSVCSQSKKNGKTVLQSSILLSELCSGREPVPYCVNASTTKENAEQVYRELEYSIKKNPKLAKLYKCNKSGPEIICPIRDAIYKGLSCDSPNSEGEDCSFTLIDELHKHQSEDLYRSLEHSGSARLNHMFSVISTCGIDQSTEWYNLFRYAEGVQNSSIIDTTFLPWICTTPDDADIEDPKVWRLSNPTWFDYFPEKQFADALKTAKQQGTGALLSFRRYKLNQWVNSEHAFISGPDYDACVGTVDPDQLRDAVATAGVDASTTFDPSAVASCHLLPDNKYYITGKGFVCDAGAAKRENTNLPKYYQYKKDGVMHVNHGNKIDRNEIKRHIIGLKDKYKNLKKVRFDYNNCDDIIEDLKSSSIKCETQAQYHKDYNFIMKQFEIAVSEKRIIFEPNNKYLRWGMINCVVNTNHNGDIKPDKDKSTDKIDIAVAAIMAFGAALDISMNKNKYRGDGSL